MKEFQEELIRKMNKTFEFWMLYNVVVNTLFLSVILFAPEKEMQFLLTLCWAVFILISTGFILDDTDKYRNKK